MTVYIVRDDHQGVRIPSESPEAAAREYVDGGDWGWDWGGDPARLTTLWITVSVTAACEDCARIADDPQPCGECLADGSDTHTIAVDPPEPACLRGRDAHDWRRPHRLVGGLAENPGVTGNGGGAYIMEICMCCGAGKTTDTWATDPGTGEQGLESISYEPGAYDLTAGEEE